MNIYRYETVQPWSASYDRIKSTVPEDVDTTEISSNVQLPKVLQTTNKAEYPLPNCHQLDVEIEYTNCHLQDFTIMPNKSATEVYIYFAFELPTEQSSFIGPVLSTTKYALTRWTLDDAALKLEVAHFYDYFEFPGKGISVDYATQQVFIINHESLTDRPSVLEVDADTLVPKHELVMSRSGAADTLNNYAFDDDAESYFVAQKVDEKIINDNAHRSLSTPAELTLYRGKFDAERAEFKAVRKLKFTDDTVPESLQIDNDNAFIMTDQFIIRLPSSKYVGDGNDDAKSSVELLKFSDPEINTALVRFQHFKDGFYAISRDAQKLLYYRYDY
jgi:hypothetical protein